MNVAPHAVESGELLVGGVPASRLTREFGSPLYVYDAGVVEARYRALRAALPGRARIAYALKANPSLALATLLSRAGCGAEAASRGELLLARRAGFSPESCFMAGPAKSAADHREALEWGIRAVHVESAEEMGRLDRIAGAMGMDRAPIGFRVNTVAAVEEERSIIGGAGPRKFGTDEEGVADLLDRLHACERLELTGIHVFNATNVRDAGRLADNARRILVLAREIAEEASVTLSHVDVGGGLGIPYGPADEPLDLAVLGGRLAGALEEEGRGALAGAELVLEPGRWLVGEAGVYLCTVVEVKASRGRRYALVDGGIHHLLRPALLQAPHPVLHATRTDAPPDDVFDVTGPLCTGVDVLARSVPLPEPRPGDVLAILCSGAYGYTESMLRFLSHPAPAEVVVRSGEAAVARPRVEPESVLSEQTVPGFL